MTKFRVQSSIITGRIDPAPFLSLLAIVILFLLIHTMITFTPGVKVNLPTDGAWPGATGPAISVTIDSAGQLFFENQIITEDDLRDRLAAARERAESTTTLIIQADASVDFQRVVHLSGLARSAGIAEVVLATRANAFAPPRRQP